VTDFLSVRPLWRGRAPLSSLRTFTNSIHLTLIAASDFTLRRILRSRLVNSVSDDINRQVRIGTPAGCRIIHPRILAASLPLWWLFARGV
jgi:hypothetical protein